MTLCINQCMASLGIKVNGKKTHDTSLLAPADPISTASISAVELPEQDIIRVRSHASLLMEQGDWCAPSCVSQCGNIIMSLDLASDELPPTSHSQKILSCFRDTCKCKRTETEAMSLELFQKH
mmetsp:Transcript_39004/g.59368  ORF Transcript_39004/g.59368 Transcript_39004/m.59368 type:complete len:123 (+) Transcript_39004:511-879(+)